MIPSRTAWEELWTMWRSDSLPESLDWPTSENGRADPLTPLQVMLNSYSDPEGDGWSINLKLGSKDAVTLATQLENALRERIFEVAEQVAKVRGVHIGHADRYEIEGLSVTVTWDEYCGRGCHYEGTNSLSFPISYLWDGGSLEMERAKKLAAEVARQEAEAQRLVEGIAARAKAERKQYLNLKAKFEPKS